MTRRLAALFDVRAGEGRAVVLLALHSFLLGLSTSLFETAAESLFLSRWGADSIAFIYLGWAIAVPLAGLVYARLVERIHVTRVWAATVLAITVLDVLFVIALEASETRWIPFVMMVARDLFWTLMLMEFWELAGWLLDLQQAKRLFGVVGGGEMAGGILAGLAIGPLLRVVEIPHVILITAAGYFGCFGILRALVKGRREGAGGGGDEEAGPPADVRSLFRVRYVALVLLAPVAFTLAYDFLEYGYLGQAEARYRDDPERMAAFLGAVLATWQTLALIGRTTLSGRLLRRFGLWAALFLTPTLLVLGSAALLTLSLTAPEAGLLFWPVIGLKVVDAVVRNAIDKPSFLVLFQVLSQELRVRVHAFSESFSEPLTAGLSGVVLLVATRLLGGEALAAKVGGVAAILLVIAAVWLGFVWRLRPEYDRMLARAVTRHTLLGGQKLVPERSMIDGLRACLAGGDAVAVCYALEALRPLLEPGELTADLARLLAHDDPAVRREAARHVEELAPAELRPVLEARMAQELAPDVLGAVLRAHAAVAGGDAVERLEPYLASGEGPVRRGALVGLLQHGGISGVLAAGETILGLVASPSVADRILAAEILGEVAIRDFHHPLAHLLDDRDRGVRRAALSAAATVRSPRLIPRLIAALAEPALAPRAVRALAAAGADAVAAIDETLAGKDTPAAVRRRLAAALGGIAGPRAALLLLRHLDDPLPEVRREVVRALEPHAVDLAAEHRARLLAQLEREAGRAAEIASARLDVGDCQAAAELIVALDEQARAAGDMAVTLLILLHPGSSLALARASLGEAGRHAYALEIIDRTASREAKRLVLPLIEALGGQPERIATAPRLALHARLATLISGNGGWVGSWSRVAALYTAGTLAAVELAPAVEVCVDDADPIVRETALATLATLSASGRPGMRRG